MVPNEWEIDGETVETVSDIILGGSKITADGDCSHEIKRCLLLGRKVMTKLDSIFKSRAIISPTKVHLVKAIIITLLFNLHSEYIMQNARLDEAQAGIKISRRNIKNLRYADENTLSKEVKRN